MLDLLKISEALPPHPVVDSERLPGDYSHGLERIYAPRETDPFSVRPLPPPADEEQLVLPFAAEGQGIMPSLRLSEPVEVLSISASALDHLQDLGIQTVGEVFDRSEELGGEFSGAVARHLADLRDPFRCQEVEFASLVRILLGDLDRVGVHLFLRSYCLEQLLPLRRHEMAALQRLRLWQRERRREEIVAILRERERQERLFAVLRQVHAEFVAPWLARCLGFAAKRALNNRLRAVCADRPTMERVIHLLNETFAPGKKEIWSLLLQPVAKGVYSLNVDVAAHYEMVVAHAKTYFYHRTVHYPLAQLVALVAQEVARRWRGFPAGFVERVIRHDPAFRLRRGRGPKRIVRLS